VAAWRSANRADSLRRYPWLWRLYAVVALINSLGLAVCLYYRPIDEIALAGNSFGLLGFGSLTVWAWRARPNAKNALVS
jgi:hypothetical protein